MTRRAELDCLTAIVAEEFYPKRVLEDHPITSVNQLADGRRHV